MKKSTILISLFVAFMLVVSGCKKKVNIEHYFKEGKVIVQINAQKTGIASPWNVTLSAKAYGFEKGSLTFEQPVKSLTAENITLNWIDENTCIIGFPDDDGSVHQFKLIASETQFYLAEEANK